jgi:La domain
MTEEQLIDAVRKQVEYYFSKENLQSDAYLTSQMDANMSVPIAVVMKVMQ